MYGTPTISLPIVVHWVECMDFPLSSLVFDGGIAWVARSSFLYVKFESLKWYDCIACGVRAENTLGRSSTF